MYYIKSTSQKTYTVMGKTIPACVTRDNDYLKVDNKFYNDMVKVPVIRSLINAGALLVLDKEPESLKNSIKGLSASNAELIAKNTALEERIKVLESKNTSAEDISALNAKVADQEEQYKALEEEAKSEIASRDSQIEELKKRLAEAEAKVNKE